MHLIFQKSKIAVQSLDIRSSMSDMTAEQKRQCTQNRNSAVSLELPCLVLFN